MVFYTCSGCGESLKRNKVEKHFYICGSCEYLTCIDCSEDFWGNDYLSHTSCISEEEKYAATGFKAKPNKGEIKQQEWIKKVEKASSECKNLSDKARLLLEDLQNYGNIPRKKGKFLNFLKNSLKIRDVKLAEEVWNIFAKMNKPAENSEEQKEPTKDSTCEKTSLQVDDVTEEQKNEGRKKKKSNKKSHLSEEKDKDNSSLSVNNENGIPKGKLKKRKKEKKANGVSDDKDQNKAPTILPETKDKKLSKKRKRDKENSDGDGKKIKLQEIHPLKKDKSEQTKEHDNKQSASADTDSGKFPWFRVIKTCLKSSSEHELSIKRLKKKVLNEYAAYEMSRSTKSPSLTENQLNAAFMKKVNKNPKFLVLKDKVKLVRA